MYCHDLVIVLEGFSKHCECGRGSSVKEVVMVMMVLSFSVFMSGCCYSNTQGWSGVV